MRSSWNQSRVWDGDQRFPNSMRSWFSRFGSVTQFIIFLTVAVFFVQLAGDFFGWQLSTADGLRTKAIDLIFGLSGAQLSRGFVWQPVTYMLLHDGIWHILINLFMLWMFGREVEYFIGAKSYAKLYVLSGVLGGLVWLAFNLHSASPLVGASAAVMACLIAFATLFPDREITFLIFFVLPVTLRARYIAYIALAFDIVPLLQHDQTNVAHLAHLGGALLGYVYVKSLGYGGTPRWMAWLQDRRPQLRPAAPVTRRRSMTPEQFMREEVDPILEKISRDGMQSLTKAERKILESAKDLMQKKRR